MNTSATGPYQVGERLETMSQPPLEKILGRPLDEVSWQALEDRYPAVAAAVREATTNYYSPQQVRQYILQRGMPMSWACWLEQAARFLKGDGE